jgi:hypothetical protein
MMFLKNYYIANYNIYHYFFSILKNIFMLKVILKKKISFEIIDYLHMPYFFRGETQ